MFRKISRFGIAALSRVAIIALLSILIIMASAVLSRIDRSDSDEASSDAVSAAKETDAANDIADGTDTASAADAESAQLSAEVRTTETVAEDVSIDTSSFLSPDSKNNLDLVTFAEQVCETGWGYVEGTYGEVLTEELLQQAITAYPTEVGTYEDTIRVRWLGHRTVDSIGLLKAYCWLNASDGQIESDTTVMPDVNADALFAAAEESGSIDSMPETQGLIVYYTGHVGIYIGDGEVVEARDTASGVVKTSLSGSDYTDWFKLPYITYYS